MNFEQSYLTRKGQVFPEFIKIKQTSAPVPIDFGTKVPDARYSTNTSKSQNVAYVQYTM